MVGWRVAVRTDEIVFIASAKGNGLTILACPPLELNALGLERFR